LPQGITHNAESELTAPGGMTCVYDGDGNRIEKLSNGSVTKIYWYASGKYLYDFERGQFQGMSRTKSAELLSGPEVQDAIQKGLKYFGM
jgi:hypothetical protein